MRRPAPSGTASASALARTEPVDADALYRDAHRTHFSGQDFARAVVAWDRYLLQAGPGAKMALEARYNRAVALARSGRDAEAVLALRPFAEGDYGGYRRIQVLHQWSFPARAPRQRIHRGPRSIVFASS